MNKKQLGLLLIAAGSAGGAITVVISFLNRGQGGGYVVMILLAAGSIVIGSILAFTQILDHYARPIVEQIGEDIKDDIADVKAKRFTTAQLMVGVTGVLFVAFLFFMLRLRKLSAMWDGFPVVIPTLVLVGVVTWVVTRSAWFKNQSVSTPKRIFAIPAAGIILSMLMGINLTEPVQIGAWGGEVSGTRAVEVEQPGESLEFASDLDSSFFELPECEDEGCEMIFLVVALVVLTLLMVVGSAFIPHFWFLSGSVLLTVLLLMTLHEIRLKPQQRKDQPQPE